MSGAGVRTRSTRPDRAARPGLRYCPATLALTLALATLAQLAQLATPTPARADATIETATGLNFVSYPVAVPPGFTCANLKTLFGATSVLRFDPNTEAVKECAAQPFPIAAGEAYTVVMPSPADRLISGNPSCPSLDLRRGANYVGVPTPVAGMTCYGALQQIGIPGVVASVSRFDLATGAYQACAFGVGEFEGEPVGRDFPIASGEGYLVSMASPLSFVSLNDLAQCDVDSDSDGWLDSLDCKPNDPAIHPGATEICGNAVDEDCSRFVDDLDADGDGFVAQSCGGDDSDDADLTVHPGAAEICNDGVDNDSNGLMDDDDLECSPGCDQDGDGLASLHCGGPDADDSDPTSYAGAPELCGDFIDNDADGGIDEGCNPANVALGPTGVVLLAQDSRSFILLDEQDRPIAWEFDVDGVAGGNASVGTVATSTVNPRVAIYTAPDLQAGSLTVTLRGVDPANPGESASVAVTVVAPQGTYVILPPVLTLGLGREQPFIAGMNVDNLGFVRLHRAFWKVNGVLEQVPQAGQVDAAGRYRAPARLPDALPFPISVGFSLAENQAVAAAAAVTLADLDLAPIELRGLVPGPVGQLVPTLRFSSGVVQNPPVGEMGFGSRQLNIASVAANGTVSIGASTGRAQLRATHVPTLTRAGAVALSLSDLALRIVTQVDRAYYAREHLGATGTQLIEFTRPGAAFYALPSLRILRGEKEGQEVANGRSTLIAMTATPNILLFDSRDGLPDLSGFVAGLDPRTRRVTIGGTPGTGTITVAYDDGFVAKNADLDVVFSRPQLTLSATGSISGVSSEFFVTEFIDVTVSIANPNGSFLGETPIRVQLGTGAGEPFKVAFGNKLGSGKGESFLPLNLFAESESEGFQLTGGSSADPFETQSFFDPKLIFKLSPRRVGEHRFQFALAHDPGAPVQELVFQVKRPDLKLLGCDATNPGAAPVNHVLRNNWAGVSSDSPASVLNVYDSFSVFGFGANDLPIWTVTDPSQQSETIPQNPNRAALTRSFEQAGGWSVTHAMTQRPEIASNPLAVPVLAPSGGSFPELAAAGKQAVLDDGNPIPLASQAASFEILSPGGGGWALGVPIPVSVQIYRSDGTPGIVGRTRVSRAFANGVLQSETRFHDLVRVSANALSGPTVSLQGSTLPNAQGLVNFSVTPTTVPVGQEDADLLLAVRFAALTTIPEAAEYAGVLAEQVDNSGTGAPPSGPRVPIGFAQFTDTGDRSFREQCTMLAGTALATDPREIPVASQRVRDAVTAGRLPPGSQHLRFDVLGGPQLAASIASGIALPNIDLGTGLAPIAVQADAQARKLTITASSNLAAFNANSGLYGMRPIALTFGDGREWMGRIHLFGARVEVPSEHQDRNIPLNGRHHNAHPIGAAVYSVQSVTFQPTLRIELELLPSLLPQTLFDQLAPANPVLDFWEPAANFRGAPVDQSTVGFRREKRAAGGEETLGLETELFWSHNQFFPVFANTNDNRSLDPSGGVLGPEGAADFLPDFPSPAQDREALLAKLEGNLADILSFSAYNIVARIEEALEQPGERTLAFSDLLRDAFSTYAKPATDTTSNLIASVRQGAPVRAFVDREAVLGELVRDFGLLNGNARSEFFGGVLDQYFSWIGNERFLAPTFDNAFHRIGVDGRVGSYDGEGSRNPCLSAPTGRTRRCFGIELDGVLYDPSASLLPDEAPNSPALTGIDVVANTTGGAAALTAKGLLPDVGGTSGGYYDIDPDYAGSHFALVKTPGQDFPGVDTGYLIDLKPDELRTGGFFVPDDFEEAVIRRNPTPMFDGRSDVLTIAGAPIADDDVVFPQHRVMGFAEKFDGKGPMTTSLESTQKFEVLTDPPLVTSNGAPEQKKIRTALLVQQRRPAREDSVDLLVTTRSEGNEGEIKGALDALTDLVVDVVAGIVLSTMTEGLWIAECGGSFAGEILGNVTTALINANVNAIDAKLVEQGLIGDDGSWMSFTNNVLQGGQGGIIPGVPDVKLTVKDLVEPLVTVKNPATGEIERAVTRDELKRRFKEFHPTDLALEKSLREIPICAVLSAPFEAFKDEIQNAYTVAELGGEGAASAQGVRTLAISIPREAKRGNSGLYNVAVSVTQDLDILPEWPEAVDADSISTNFASGADIETDLDLILRVLAARSDPDPALVAEAEQVYTRLRIQGLRRDVSSAHSSVYDGYKVRFASVPPIELLIAPNGLLPTGSALGDFVLTTNVSEIPVRLGSVVRAARSNQNASARAALRSEGLDMRLLGVNLLGSFDPQ